MDNLKKHNDWMETGVLCDLVTPEDERYLSCIADACEQYGIQLSTANETERRFIFERAEEMLRDKVTV